PTYPGSVAAARRSWAAQNKSALVGYIRGFDAGYAWLKDRGNKEAAIKLLPSRLNIDRATAEAAYEQIATLPLPAISDDGLRQVIPIVWASEGLPGAQGATAKYMDLSYLNTARQPR